MKLWQEEVNECRQKEFNYENWRDWRRTKCRTEGGRTAQNCSSWKQPKKHTFAGRFSPFFQGLNGRFPQPAQDKPSSLFLLFEWTMTLITSLIILPYTRLCWIKPTSCTGICMHLFKAMLCHCRIVWLSEVDVPFMLCYPYLQRAPGMSTVDLATFASVPVSQILTLWRWKLTTFNAAAKIQKIA
jgi:hypothetical protein